MSEDIVPERIAVAETEAPATESLKPRCPACGSRQIYRRRSTQDWVCRRCGSLAEEPSYKAEPQCLRCPHCGRAALYKSLSTGVPYCRYCHSGADAAQGAKTVIPLPHTAMPIVGADTPASAELLAREFFARRSPHTRRAYARDWTSFALFLGAASVGEAINRFVSMSAVEAHLTVKHYGDYLSERNLSVATRNRHLASLKSLTKLARQLGLISWRIELEAEAHEFRRDTAGPTHEQYLRLLWGAELQTNRKQAARDVALLRLLHDLALRSGEVVELELAHVDLPGRSISIRGKGRRERQTLTMPSATAEGLARWIAARGDAPGPLFQSLRGKELNGYTLREIILRLSRLAGLRAFSTHALRHAGITRALSVTGGDTPRVLRFSRHKAVSTLLGYDDRQRQWALDVAELVAEEQEFLTPVRQKGNNVGERAL